MSSVKGSLMTQTCHLVLEMKRCTVCKEDKPLTEFVKRSDSPSKLRSGCRQCASKSKRKWVVENKEHISDYSYQRRLRDYGITQEEHEAMLAKQKGCCKICGVKFGEYRTGQTAVIDHCHRKGHVRGILCMKCNTGIGLFSDKTERIKSAIKYLNENDPLQPLRHCQTSDRVLQGRPGETVLSTSV